MLYYRRTRCVRWDLFVSRRRSSFGTRSILQGSREPGEVRPGDVLPARRELGATREEMNRRRSPSPVRRGRSRSRSPLRNNGGRRSPPRRPYGSRFQVRK